MQVAYWVGGPTGTQKQIGAGCAAWNDPIRVVNATSLFSLNCWLLLQICRSCIQLSCFLAFSPLCLRNTFLCHNKTFLAPLYEYETNIVFYLKMYKEVQGVTPLIG